MDLIEGRPILILGLIWQIIKLQLTSNISLKDCPELVLLLEDGEELEDLLKLSAEDILLRWFNYHLKNSGSARRVKNFGSDLKDSECYSILLNQISKVGSCKERSVELRSHPFNNVPAANPDAVSNDNNNAIIPNSLRSPQCGLVGAGDDKAKAAQVIANANAMGVESFIQPGDIVKGNKKLNLGFCAQIFNTNSGLVISEEEVREAMILPHVTTPY